MGELYLDFHDTATAFADKTNSELKEKYRLFKLLNSPILNSLGAACTKFALSIGLPVEGLIKSTIYEQFCGGETIEECDPAIAKLGASHVGTILDYSVEGKATEEDFDRTRDEIIRTIERAKDDPNIPFAVFKVTGVAPLGTLERLSRKKKLDAKSQAKCERINNRVAQICEAAYKLSQPVFIDAEESWIQDAIDRLAEEMMSRFNQEQPIVFNTIQLYRHDRLEYLKNARRTARNEGYIYAAKLVRGAYMEKERDRAAEQGYPSPIYETKADTDAAYDAAIAYCLKHHDTMAFVAATHNEKSTARLAELMDAAGIPHDHPAIYYSQLYGMGDNLSYVLAKNGFNVSKYVPYGPVADAVPYLIRRANENSSASGQMSRELHLIEEELKRRKLS
jgi:proline dehydrogenase